MADKNSAIGFYDSGLGGVGVLKQTAALLPGEDFIYYGDNANAPYGGKSQEEIRALSFACGDFLFKKGVKAIVIACNTATSIVVQTMRENYNVPVISMEPAVKPAAENCPEGDILVMATPATLEQKRYHALLDRLGLRERVVDVPCIDLARLIEAGDLSNPHIKAAVYDCLAPLRDRKNVCAIVMGCTHYSFIHDQIADVAKKLLRGDCRIFDGMYGTARRVAQVLEQEGLRREEGGAGSVRFYSSSGEEAVKKLEMFFRMNLPGSEME